MYLKKNVGQQYIYEIMKYTKFLDFDLLHQEMILHQEDYVT